MMGSARLPTRKEEFRKGDYNGYANYHLSNIPSFHHSMCEAKTPSLKNHY
jgi:hypothetical protein